MMNTDSYTDYILYSESTYDMEYEKKKIIVKF